MSMLDIKEVVLELEAYSFSKQYTTQNVLLPSWYELRSRFLLCRPKVMTVLAASEIHKVSICRLE